MDYKVVIVLVIFGIAMIALGSNPLTIREEPVEGDPYQATLEKKLKKSAQKSAAKAGGMFDLPEGSMQGSGWLPPLPAGRTTGMMGQTSGSTGGMSVGVTGMPNQNTAPVTRIGGYTLPASGQTSPQEQAAAPPPQPPPPPEPEWLRGLRQPNATAAPAPAIASAAAPAPSPAPANPVYVLKSGQAIYFSGIRVFTRDGNGQLQALPDGTHELQSGERIFIKQGRRVASE